MNQKSFEIDVNLNEIWKQVSQEDNVSSFQRIFNIFYKSLVSYSHNFTQQQVISEEIVQEVFISLWERRNEINISNSLKSYLYRAVKNRTINYIKNQLPKDRATTDLGNYEYLEDESSETDESSDLKDLINKAIAGLPEKCRVIFLLSRNEGLSHKEIAEELDISPKTVENQIGIAIKKLKSAINYFGSAVIILMIFKIVLTNFWGVGSFLLTYCCKLPY